MIHETKAVLERAGWLDRYSVQPKEKNGKPWTIRIPHIISRGYSKSPASTITIIIKRD